MFQLPRLSEGDDDEPTVQRDAAFVQQTLLSRLPPGRDIVVVTVRAPTESLEKFLRLVPRDGGFLWRSPNGRMAGGGETVTLKVSGDDRLTRLRDMATTFWDRLHIVSNQDASIITPVLFGGIAFAPDVPLAEPWQEFTEDAFTLTRWTYHRRGDDSFLSIAMREDELAHQTIAEVVTVTEKILRQLRTEAPTSLISARMIPLSAVHHSSLGEWTDHLGAILAAIRSGEYSKIVAARRCVVDLDHPLEDTGFIARLSAAYPDCTHFAVRRANSTFLGATPETLFRKIGTQLSTHALAGTVRIADDDPMRDHRAESAALRRSEKDLEEHALVVKRICDELWPMVKKLRFSSTPHARRVRDLVHLQTPITAELRPDIHVFDVLSAFHPTPAVGGFPARAAADWIRRHEPLERGWYTGAVGWFDAAGNAEFAVAIRCGVATPERVHIYGGAGIVERSDIVSEYEETGAKMHPILRALGVAF